MRLLARPLRGWRPALRIARREALRARGRSALVLVMVGLPVLAIVCLDTLARTQAVSPREGLTRQLGSADALVTYDGETGPVDQSPTLSARSSAGPAPGQPPLPAPTTETLRRLLGPGTRVLEVRQGRTPVRTAVGEARPDTYALDLRDPMTRGLFDLRSGRFPRTADEVVVSDRLAGRGFPVGSTLTLGDGTTRHVVGTVESATTSGLSLLAGLPAAVGLVGTEATGTDALPSRTWLVSRPGGVDWPAVRALNRHALFALSRQVVEHPPPSSQVTVEQFSGGRSAATVTVLALIVAMALLEVVLLAGPAFAVGARRQQRALALMAAGGGEPPHLRRVVLASGVVLGAAASVLGAAGGVGVAWLAGPLLQGFSDTRFGPFETSLRDIVVVALCGLVSALLAALVPAVLAARQDVVAVLTGRRGETRPTRWSPALGTVLLLAGVGGAAYGARRPANGEVAIALAAVLAVLGMVLLTPLAVSRLGRLARLLPLPARFAVRDAARHRSRTAPAVAAVAATVAGVVALGIGGASDAAERRAMYAPAAPSGAGVVRAWDVPEASWAAFAAAVRETLPGAHVTAVHGVDESGSDQYELTLPGRAPGFTPYGDNLGAAFLVGADGLHAVGLPRPAERRAEAALARGDLVVFDRGTRGRVQVSGAHYDEDGAATPFATWRGRATFVMAPGSQQPARAVLPTQVAGQVGIPVVTTSLLVDGVTIDQHAEDTIDEALGGLDENANLYVERGFQDDRTRVVLLLLGVVGGVLVLGGTLTATFLALSDARPDFATMGAVGAAPRTRRLVAACYAATIGLLGAVMGAVVGFVPGIAVTFPLTGSSWAGPGATTAEGNPIPGHFLDVPWLLVGGLVLALPVLTALVVGLASRARLPMVSRLA